MGSFSRADAGQQRLRELTVSDDQVSFAEPGAELAHTGGLEGSSRGAFTKREQGGGRVVGRALSTGRSHRLREHSWPRPGAHQG